MSNKCLLRRSANSSKKPVDMEDVFGSSNKGQIFVVLETH